MADADRLKLWRAVENTMVRLEATAPDGYRPIAELYLAGRRDPVRLSRVQMRADFPWLFLSALTDDRPGDGMSSPGDHLLLARDDAVERIEIRFEQLGEVPRHPLGFSLGEIAEGTLEDERTE